MKSIFRQQVLQERGSRTHGDVVLLPSVNYLWVTVGAFVVFVTVLIWLANTTVVRKEKVKGWVESKSGILNVYSIRQGLIEKILVHEGQFVENGQPLIKLSFKEMLETGGIYKKSVIDEQLNQENSLKTQLGRLEKIYQLKKEDYLQQIALAKDNLNTLEKEIQTKDSLVDILRKKMGRVQELFEQGHVAVTQVEDAKQQLLIAQSDRQELQRQYEQQTGTLRQTEIQLKLLPDDKENQIDSLKYQLSANNRLLLQYKSEQSVLIYASKSGTVSNLQVKEGQLLTNTEVPLLSISPVESGVELQALVPMSAIGFVEVGQDIKIKYDTFPYQKFGFFSGKIVEVSKGILLPNEIARLPVKIDEAYYLIKITPARNEIVAYGKQVPIRPGMTFVADVVLDRRSILEWLLDPIYSIKGSL